MKHKETLMYVLITLMGNLLPTIITLLYYAANPEKFTDFSIIYNEGQFYLYCASFLTTSAYVFYTFKVLNTDSNSLLVFVSSILIFIVSLLYVFNLLGSNNNQLFLSVTSGTSFFISLVIYYYANYVNSVKVDVISAQKAQVEEILNSLPK